MHEWGRTCSRNVCTYSGNQTLLERNGLGVEDVDVYEHNEAFAAASCAVAKKSSSDREIQSTWWSYQPWTSIGRFGDTLPDTMLASSEEQVATQVL